MDLGEFEAPLPYVFSEIYLYFLMNPLAARPNGLGMGDIIVAGRYDNEEPNAAMVVCCTEEMKRRYRWHKTVSVSDNVEILQWPPWV